MFFSSLFFLSQAAVWIRLMEFVRPLRRPSTRPSRRLWISWRKTVTWSVPPSAADWRRTGLTPILQHNMSHCVQITAGAASPVCRMPPANKPYHDWTKEIRVSRYYTLQEKVILELDFIVCSQSWCSIQQKRPSSLVPVWRSGYHPPCPLHPQFYCKHHLNRAARWAAGWRAGSDCLRPHSESCRRYS